MSNKEQTKINEVSLFAIAINISIFLITWIKFSEKGSIKVLEFTTYKMFFIIYAIIQIYLDTIFDSFAFNRRKITENAYSLSLSNVISMLIFYFLDTLAYRRFYKLNYIVIATVLCVLINVIISKYANIYILKKCPKKKIYIYYKNDIDLSNIKKLTYFNYKYEVIEEIKNPKKYKLDKNCETIFISGIETSIREEIIKECLKKKIEVFVFPNIGDILISGGKYVEELSTPMFKIETSKNNRLYEITKRLFDVVISAISIVFLSPLMFLTALIIKLYDNGSILYKQPRLTKDGKVFTIYKFRSMKENAENDGVARISTKNDNRITPIGRIIRRIRLDELPQLINVLKGEMSIVGPRPERPEIAKQYEAKYPSFNLRLEVKAGLTGYAQVYGKYNSDPADKLKMDLFYINKRSLIYDIKLCFMTIKILFMKDSTEALEEGQIIAGD